MQFKYSSLFTRKKEWPCCPRNFQNASKRNIIFGLTEFFVLQLFSPLKFSFFGHEEILQTQTGHSSAVMNSTVNSTNLFMETQVNLKAEVFRLVSHQIISGFIILSEKYLTILSSWFLMQKYQLIDILMSCSLNYQLRSSECKILKTVPITKILHMQFNFRDIKSG